MKVNSRIYKGIEYVQLSDLPVDQQEKIKELFTEDFLIKILIDKSIVSNCIQYKDYLNWFDKNYSSEKVAIKRERPSGSPSLEIAIGKA